MDYKPKYFNPGDKGGEVDKDTQNVAFRPEDGKAEDLYVFAPKVILAVNVAMATGRPLLVSGEPGCGKSSLARSAAAVLGRRYYHHTVTSRMQATELLWTFDALRRLNDASKQGAVLLPERYYVEPGPLWWALDPKTAEHRGSEVLEEKHWAKDRGVGPKGAAVVLIDEIDKADPDVPNDLLEPFDRKSFTVRETGDEITGGQDVLMVLTTNRERTMPRAFVRRCVTLELDEPTASWLANIASRRYEESALHLEVALEVMALRVEAKNKGIREPSTAEYLDAVVAARELEAKRTSADWTEVKRALLWKSDVPFPTAKAGG